MTATILVIGGTGTVGKALLQQLRHRNTPVRALVRDAAKADAIASDLVEAVIGDLSDPATLAPALAGIERVFALAAVDRDSVALFANLNAAAREAGVQHLVKFSAMGARPDATAVITRHHGRSDRALIDSGLTYTILRPNAFFQNLLAQAPAIRAQRRFFLPMGDAAQSAIDVRDIAEVAARILRGGGYENRVLTLTGPDPLTPQDMAAQISRSTGQKTEYVAVTPDDAVKAMREAGMPRWQADAIAELQAVFATGAYASVTNDVAEVLGRAPRPFRDFARDFTELFR